MPNCPKCGADGAYIGLQEIECRNCLCEYYKESKPPEPDAPDATTPESLSGYRARETSQWRLKLHLVHPEIFDWAHPVGRQVHVSVDGKVVYAGILTSMDMEL